MKTQSSSPCSNPPIPDYHTHTYLCKHAKGMPEEYVAEAIRKGLPQICFTDHAPAPCGYDHTSRMEIDEFPHYKELISQAQTTTEIEVLYGIEADYYNGCEDFLSSWLPQQDFDIVLGSVHFIAEWGFDNEANILQWKTANVNDVWKRYFILLGKLADTRLFDVVGHIDLPKKFGHKTTDNIIEIARPALERIASAGMAIEINTSGLDRPVNEMYPSLQILRLCHDMDIPITFGSDSHIFSDIGRHFAKALVAAKKVGYTHSLHFRKRQSELIPLP
ncbi:MAG: histidinol-phosphatase HisJ family protein [Kiritimatiellae bacterium]|nr:histidinol-phosphatase HisJ family protein [Kiritimatiellia bacterium]